MEERRSCRRMQAICTHVGDHQGSIKWKEDRITWLATTIERRDARIRSSISQEERFRAGRKSLYVSRSEKASVKLQVP